MNAHTDSGALLLRQADLPLDLTPRIAACLKDHRCQERRPVRQLAAQRLFGLSLGFEDVNDLFRGDSVLEQAVGRPDLTGEERVRERDRGIPLTGRREPPGRARRGRDAPVHEDHPGSGA